MKKTEVPTYTVEEILTAIQPYYVPILHKGYPVHMASQATILMLPQLLASQRNKAKERGIELSTIEVDKIETVKDIFAEIYHVLEKAKINWVSLITSKANVDVAVEVVKTTLFLDPMITAIIENGRQESIGLRFIINGSNYVPINSIDFTKAKQILKAVKEYDNDK